VGLNRRNTGVVVVVDDDDDYDYDYDYCDWAVLHMGRTSIFRLKLLNKKFDLCTFR
jgi:hypothetical protein